MSENDIRVIATVTDCVQVGMNEFRDINRSKEFGPDSRFSEVIKWAKSINENHDFHSIRFSAIEDPQ